jgi:hypothetical protein
MDPKPAGWPDADFVVGNPPFIGNKRMREALGDGYTEALRLAYKGVIPDSADFVMYWWYKAAKILSEEKTERFGFITTNSITQSFNRKIIEDFFASSNPISIAYAIPNHPWVDSSDGAAVRIAMTSAIKGQQSGRIDFVISEEETSDSFIEVKLLEKVGIVHSNLNIGANLSNAKPLKANQEVSARGIIPHGEGFIVSLQIKEKLESESIEKSIIKPYRNGRDINQIPRNVYVIDTYGLSQTELRIKYPQIYQWLLERVKPERDENNDKVRRENWWLHARSNEKLRSAIKNLSRYIVTVQTSKFRNFTFLSGEIMPDDKLIAIGFDDSFILGILSSEIHAEWASAIGSRMGVGNDLVYDKNRCFETFPFPIANEGQKQQIRTIAEQLDAHRKQRQALHPMLTITDMYNVLEKLRSGETLHAKDQKIHEQGLVSILLQLHTELDAAVADAYGWPANLTEEEILEKLVALNKERAAEEANGLIRWLRPEYQNPQGVQQTGMHMTTTETPKATTELPEWPKTLAEQAQAVQRMVQQYHHPISAADIAGQFEEAKKAANAARMQQIENILETIYMLGLLRKTEEGGYVR